MKHVLDTYTLHFVYDDYNIDITVDPDVYESWIYREECTVKMFMFGQENNGSLNEYVDIVEKNVEQYADIYEEKYHLPFD